MNRLAWLFTLLGAAARADGPNLAPPEPPPENTLLQRGPPSLPVPAGTVVLSDKVHLVPIHLYPIRAGLHETFAVVVDGEHGMPALRLQIAGAGVEGGAEGEIGLGRANRLHGVFLNTPNLLLVQAEDTLTLFRRTLPGNREVSGGFRAGAQLWNVPNLIVAQAYLQAGARVDALLEGRRHLHFDAYAGTGSIVRFRSLADLSDRLEPGLEVSASLVLER